MAITDNQVVSIFYEVKDVESSEVVDSNLNESKPLTFILGKGQIIKGLEDGLRDSAQGESKDIYVKAVDGYGEFDEQAVQTLPREQFAGIELATGMTLYGQAEDGATVAVIVKDFNEETTTIDYNHPLAGKDLMFSVNVTMVRDASDEEITTGQPFENAHSDSSCSTGGSCGCH
jgi:FKBP-type peptidyl-prolyl cis-trans isomerase SlyD